MRATARAPSLAGDADDPDGLCGIKMSDLARTFEAHSRDLLLVVLDQKDGCGDCRCYELVDLDLQTLEERRALGRGDLCVV